MKTIVSSPFARAAAAIAFALLTASCTSIARSQSADSEDITQVGSYVTMYEGQQLTAVVGYRYADQSIGHEWLLLDVALSTPYGKSAEISRDGISIQPPTGTAIPLASQKEFLQSLGKLKPEIQHAKLINDPLGYFPDDGRAYSPLEFFTLPGRHVVQRTHSLSSNRVYHGLLFFHIPQTVTPGTWSLDITLASGQQLSLPFQLGPENVTVI